MIDFNSPYIILEALSVVVILSYFFNIISKKTNIPSVLMLIITGLGVQQLLNYTDTFDTEDLMPILESRCKPALQTAIFAESTVQAIPPRLLQRAATVTPNEF